LGTTFYNLITVCGDFVSSKALESEAIYRDGRRVSNETQCYVNHHVSPLDPLRYVSHGGGHRSRVRAGRVQEYQWDPHDLRLALRNAGARRAAIGGHHSPPRLAPWVGRLHRSH